MQAVGGEHQDQSGDDVQEVVDRKASGLTCTWSIVSRCSQVTVRSITYRSRARRGTCPPRQPAGGARPVPVPLARRRVGDGGRGAAAARTPARREARAAGRRGRRARASRARRAYVSRGGIKLANALDALGVDVAGRHALDVGASTGGFTDCLLQRGAAHVVALDVAYGELDWRLRNDPRVTVIERRNARSLAPDELPYAPDLIVIDVSFISLAKVLPAVLGVRRAAVRLPGDGQAAVRGRARAGRQGRRGARRRRCAARRSSASARAGASSARRCSATRLGPAGPKGNRETFVWLAEGGPGAGVADRRGRRAARRSTP